MSTWLRYFSYAIYGVVAWEIYEHTQGRCLYDRMTRSR